MNIVDIIRTKRDGYVLSDDQIRWFIDGFASGSIAAEQASALLMAVFWRGLGGDELATWTDAMIRSGRRLDLSRVGRPTVDKHSTGGVGDKISLPLCPLVAACGIAVPQLSGRGLGHTGGTLDKMESISGWSASLGPAAFIDQLADCGAVIAAAGDDLAPADRRMYALRDITATVESIPLIASSIMSKKIAEGAEALVLDVKFGSGAFMADIDRATELAETMVGIGLRHGVDTTALITDMDQPLGRAVGNAVEVAESLEVLAGRGPADVVELTVRLAETMVELAARRHGGAWPDPADILASGAAMDVWRRMVRAQGGDPDAPLPAGRVEILRAPSAGVVERVDARRVGQAVWRLGAGRAAPGDAVSARAGVVLRVVAGERVDVGDPLAEVHIDDAHPNIAGDSSGDVLVEITALLESAFEFGDAGVPRAPVVARRIGPAEPR